MMASSAHRLDGLEPDNLLAFLALLGLLRSLEAARPEWIPRAAWTVDAPPVRPVLHLRVAATREEVADAAAAGVRMLSAAHRFPVKNLALEASDARAQLGSAVTAGGYRAALWAALVSDKAQAPNKKTVEATPLCLMFGQGHQYFLDRLSAIPRTPEPPPEGRGKSRRVVSEIESLYGALFRPWQRLDKSDSFRWDPVEDVRYAYRASDPSKAGTRTEHGANRLAAVGVVCMTVAPRRFGSHTRLSVRGGTRRRRRFMLTWPIWRDPMSRTAIKAVMSHPRLGHPDVAASLGVVELRTATRISVGKLMNFTRAEPIVPGEERDQVAPPARGRVRRRVRPPSRNQERNRLRHERLIS